MTPTILVVDDEIKLRKMLRVYLEQAQYRVVEAGNGREALFVARHEKPDLVLLDQMMPEMDGWAFLSLFRQESDIPIIMLTAKIEESDKVVGLELGADDYVTKPFGVRELMARVKATLRRANKQSVTPPDILRQGELTLDRVGRIVMVGNEPVDVTPTEFEILATFMASPGRAFSRLDLLEGVSGDAYEGYERTVDVHIRNLRAKIEPDPAKPSYIQTVYGMGYRFARGQE
jgi:DNA-binding response OmpR family regulator